MPSICHRLVIQYDSVIHDCHDSGLIDSDSINALVLSELLLVMFCSLERLEMIHPTRTLYSEPAVTVDRMRVWLVDRNYFTNK